MDSGPRGGRWEMSAKEPEGDVFGGMGVLYLCGIYYMGVYMC